MVDVTVIISAYKKSPYLIETIESVLNQDFDNYEILLSSDGCEELRDVADDYEINYSFSPKKNHSAAFNLAAFRSKGIWLKDIHWDDLMLPNCLKDLWNAKDGSLVYGNAVNFWPNGREKLYRGPDEITWDKLYPIKDNPIHVATIMFNRADFLKIGGFDEDLGFVEDYDLYLKMFCSGLRMVHCDSLVAKYRKHDGQITATLPQEKKIIEKHLLRKRYDFWNSSFTNLEQ